MKSLFFQLPIYTAGWKDFWILLKNHLEKSVPPGLLLIFTPNPEILVQVDQDPALFKILKTADILLPDGIALLLANRWIRFCQRLLFLLKEPLMPVKITEKMAGVDLADKLLVEAAKKNYLSLIIGGRNYAEFWGKSDGEMKRLGRCQKKNW